MKHRLASASGGSYVASDPGFREFELGWRALRDAEQLGTSWEGRDTALVLYRGAIRLLVRAALLRRSLASDDMDRREMWARARELPAWAALVAAKKTDETDLLDGIVTNEDGDVRLAELSDAERARALVLMSALARSLATPLEEGAYRARRVRRARRLGASLAALLLFLPVAALATHWLSRPNLALHRPVLVTQRDPDNDVDPNRVVDGDRLNLGFHTRKVPNTTLTIDLGSVKSLHRVEVYNRIDCCQDRAIPLTLQVSSDGSNYTTAARQTTMFYQWSARLPAKTRARFVRLVHEDDNYFHLAEVEVY